MQSSAVWLPGTTLHLHRVNWGSDYADVVNWTDQSMKDNYFAGLDSTDFIMPDNLPYTYIRPGQPIDLGIRFNVVQNFNYIVVDNPILPPGNIETTYEGDFHRKYYYFITASEYLAPDTTRIVVQLDTWTTYYDTTVFGQAFVTRGHLGIANSNATTDPASLRRYQSANEGLDVGSVLAPVAQDAWNLYADQSNCAVTLELGPIS